MYHDPSRPSNLKVWQELQGVGLWGVIPRSELVRQEYWRQGIENIYRFLLLGAGLGIKQDTIGLLKQLERILVPDHNSHPPYVQCQKEQILEANQSIREVGGRFLVFPNEDVVLNLGNVEQYPDPSLFVSDIPIPGMELMVEFTDPQNGIKFLEKVQKTRGVQISSIKYEQILRVRGTMLDRTNTGENLRRLGEDRVTYDFQAYPHPHYQIRVRENDKFTIYSGHSARAVGLDYGKDEHPNPEVFATINQSALALKRASKPEWQDSVAVFIDRRNQNQR